MTADNPVDRILERVELAGASVTTDQAAKLVAYYKLLEKWNRTINLTALKLQDYSAESVDRIVVEPVVFKGLIGNISDKNSSDKWFDLGSGGGSPAIPLKIVSPEGDLTMVESRSRKSAFLREAVRVLGLQGASVVTERIEDLGELVRQNTIQLVTIRAVKLEPMVLTATSKLLAPGGVLGIFGTSEPPAIESFPFVHVSSAPLPSPRSAAHLFRRI